MSRNKKISSGFTMLEILIVIGILSVITSVVVVVANPAELLRQGRDTGRIQDIRNLDKTITLGRIVKPSLNLGTTTIIYLSLPDTDTDTLCDEYTDLPSLEDGWEYRCLADENNLYNIDGTGWLPIDFSSILGDVGFSHLPTDSKNSSAEGLYYTYSLNSVTNWSLSTVLESGKYLAKTAANDGGNATSSFESSPVSWTASVPTGPTTTFTWTGTVSTSWDNGSNWGQGGTIPGASDSVVIPNVVNDPILDSGTTINDLTIQSGGILDLADNNFTVSGAFSNDGVLELYGNESVSLINDTNSGTVRYTGSGTYTDLAAGTSYFAIQFNGSGSWTLSSSITVNGDLTLSSGSFNSSSYNVALSGNFDASGSTTRSINFGSGTWTISGSRFDTTGSNISRTDSTGTVNFDSNTTINTGIGALANLFRNINLAYPGKTITLEHTTGGRMEFGADGEIRLKGGTINGTGASPTILVNQRAGAVVDIFFDAATTINSPVKIGYHTTSNTEIMTVQGGDFPNVPAVEFHNCGGVNSTVQFTADLNVPSAVIRLNPQSGYSASAYLIVDFNDKNVTAQSVVFNGASDGTNLKMGNGTIDLSGGISVDLDAGSFTLDLEGANVFVGGNWTMVNGSATITVIPGTSTVTFDGAGTSTISGSTTFNNLSCTAAGKQLTFTAGTTQTVSSLLTLTGASGNLIPLRSSTDGSKWYITDSGTENVSYVDVKDSTATNSITTSNSINSGNNANWVFP
ncbi:MAG: prepilin-type N-terminal cleavage/methylation domain-containing protein [Candidatus Paceibacterota bacterium]